MENGDRGKEERRTESRRCDKDRMRVGEGEEGSSS